MSSRWRQAERRRLLSAQERLRRRWQWWAVTVRDQAVAHLDELTAELAAVSGERAELDRRDRAEADR
jgi:hypothetical protein